MDVDKIEKTARLLLLKKINAVTQEYGFYVEQAQFSPGSFWITFDESENFNRHVFMIYLKEYTFSCFLNTLNEYMLNELKSDEEAIFLYHRCNKTQQTLLQAMTEEKRQEQQLYLFLIACHDKF